MKRVDDYLKQLSFWLPSAQRGRIVPEIRAALLDRLDDTSAAAGRPLTDTEVGRALDAFGAPATVASRYVDAAPVISAALAVFYWRVLVSALVTVVAIRLLLLVVHAGALDGDRMAHAFGQLAIGLLAAFTVVTLIFIALDRGLAAHDRGGD